MGENGRTLTRNAGFRRFWLGQAISTTGDAFAFVAMPLLVLERSGSVAQMGFVTAVACAGQIAMSLVAGVIVDRAHRRGLMIVCDLGRLALYATIPLAWGLGAPSLWLLYAVAGFASALGNLFQVAYVAAVPNLVDRDELALANGRLQATQAVTYAVGPILAGIVCAKLGATTALIFDSLSFGVSAMSLAGLRFRQERAIRDAPAHGRSALADIRDGLRFLAGEPVLRAMVVAMTAVGLLASAGLTAAVVDVLVFRLRRDLSEPSEVVGLCLGLSAFGALAGAVAAPHVKRRAGFASCFLGGTGLQAFGLMFAGLVPHLVPTIVGATFWASGLTLRAVAQISVRQERTPDSLIGRVTAATWTLIFGAATIGALLVTRLVTRVGSGRALAMTGAGLAVVVGASAFSPIARVGREV